MTKEEIESCRDMAELYLDKADTDTNVVAKLQEIGFFDAPASKRHHLAVPCGLLIHSVNVTEWLLKLTQAGIVSWEKESSPYRIGMFHDLVKCVCYMVDPLCAEGEPLRYVYKQSGYVGHGAASAMIAMSVLGVRLTPVETACICHHMGAFGLSDGQLRELDAALDYYPAEIIATHTADMLASRFSEAYRLD